MDGQADAAALPQLGTTKQAFLWLVVGLLPLPMALELSATVADSWHQ